MLKKIPLYLKILIGMALGIIWGLISVYAEFDGFSKDYIAPWGEIFIRLLKLIAIPLIFVSLVSGISNLKDISRLSKIGLKTIGLYIFSTVVAISIGLLLVNPLKPGAAFTDEYRSEFNQKYQESIGEKQMAASNLKDSGPLDFVVELVPDNIVGAAADNSRMLQLIFFAFLFGIAMVALPESKTGTVKKFIDGLNEIVLKIIDFIMKFAPFGVFALMVSLLVDYANQITELFVALGAYSGTVILGLMLMIFFVYPFMLWIFTGYKFRKFYKAIFPAQLLAFSTSSSAATLPVTMDRCEKKIGISKDICSFVLPVGATINMDGTSLYQGVAAVFIAQSYGIDLDLMQQLTIILTATLASIGAAAVPGAGIVMLVIVLESIGLPTEGIALILAVDRVLDMLRTAVNITGDSTIATIIAKSENKLIPPE
ncbi:MAG: dicarboxylate/amino acid:cation symporter [Marinilabiliales bacterium]|nr:MAG: dicarboxylate/amino acid:cation symporter [Marinilabiliales bacterium]